jgi:hypothetical protein
MSSLERTPADGWAKDFSYDYYRRLLRTLQSTFELRTLSAYRPDRPDGERVAFVRHDVDVCLDRALELARVEHELGVRATYMVLPNTPLYDLEAERDRLHLIHELGHEIALHCDLSSVAATPPTDADDGLSEAERQRIADARRRLEALGIESVGSLSFHRPSERVLEGPRTIEGLVNAYNPDLLSAYISDSTGRWREGDPIESVAEYADAERFQLLSHPVWWGNEHESPFARFSAVVDAFDDLDQRMYDELVSIYGPYDERSERMVA